MGRRSRAGERGQVAVYAVLLFPLLMLVLSLVLAVGTLEGMRARLRAQIDMAALTATQALDVAALAAGGPPRLVPDQAAQLARQYLAQNLAASSNLLAASPADIAAGARVSVTNASGIDPITGAANTAPTVSIEIRAPGAGAAARPRRPRPGRDARHHRLGGREVMTMTIAPRYRLPVAIAASVAVVLVVLVAVLVTGGGNPTPTAPPSPTASASADPGATPEGAVRAFFDAYAKARAVRRPGGHRAVRHQQDLVRIPVRRGVPPRAEGEGQGVGHDRAAPRQHVDQTTSTDATATVTFDYTEGGYNIDPATGSPLESPTVLPVDEGHRRRPPARRAVAGRRLPDADAMTALRLLLGFGLALGVLLLLAPAVMAFDPNVSVSLQTWSSDKGNGYIGVQVNGHWAPPEQHGQPVKTEFWSEWQNQGNPSPFCHAFWIIVHRTSDGIPVNSDNPESTIVCGPQSAIGLERVRLRRHEPVPRGRGRPGDGAGHAPSGR